MKTPPILTLLTLILHLIPPISAHGPRGHNHNHNHKHNHKPHTHGSRAIPSAGLDSGPNKPLLNGYSLTWHEEFTFPPSAATATTVLKPSTAKWIYDTDSHYSSNWGSNDQLLGLFMYTNTCRVEDEKIRITKQGTLSLKTIPRKNTKGGGDSWRSESGRIETVRDDFQAQRGGKLFIEAKVKTNCGCGYGDAEEQKCIWNAFRVLSDDFRGHSNYQNLHSPWPAGSKWDLPQIDNGETKIHNEQHCSTQWSKCKWHYIGFEIDRTQIGGDGIEVWRGNVLSWYVDGVKTYSLTGGDVNDWDAWVEIAHQGHFLILDGSGYLDDNGEPANTAGSRMEVDYIRAWDR